MVKYDINDKDNTVTATKKNGAIHHGEIIRNKKNDIIGVNKTIGDRYSFGHDNPKWEEAFFNVCNKNENDSFKGTEKNENGSVKCKKGTSIINGGKRRSKSRRTRKSKKTRKSRKNRRKSNRRKSRR